jgi:small subunit ribosomal protein S6
MMDVAVNAETLKELESAFRFNDAVIRNLIIRRKAPMTGNSKIFEEELKEQEKEREREQRREQEYAERRAAREDSDDESETATEGAEEDN